MHEGEKHLALPVDLLSHHLVEDTPPNHVAIALLGRRIALIVAITLAYHARYRVTRVFASTSAASTARAPDGRTGRRINGTVVGVVDGDVGLHVAELEPVAGAGGARVPDGAAVDVDDEVAVALEGELAVGVLAVVAGRVAVPHGVRSDAAAVVDDEVAVGLEVEADAVVEADEGGAGRLDVPVLTRRPGGVWITFG